MKRFLSILMSLSITASCVFPYDATLEPREEPALVLDGDIVIGGYSSVNVSYLQNFDGTFPQNRKTPEIQEWWIEDEDGNTIKPSSDNMADTRSLDPSLGYRIVMKADGKTIASEFKKTLAPPVIKSVSFQADEKNVYGYIAIDPSSDNTGYIAISTEEIWHFHAQFIQEFDIQSIEFFGETMYLVVAADTIPQENYWCWKKETNDSPLIIDISHFEDNNVPEILFTSFPRKNDRNHDEYHIRVRVRTLSKEEYQYYNNLSIEGNVANDLFSPNPGELAGSVYNVDNPSESVFGDISVYQPAMANGNLKGQYGVPEGRPDDSFFTKVPQERIPMFYYELEFRPIMGLFDDIGPYVGWAHKRCVDCTLDGGTKEAPEFTY